MRYSLPATDISWDAAFLLRVIPNMVRWLCEGAGKPSSIVVCILTWFGLWHNRFELHMLLLSNCIIITQSVFVMKVDIIAASRPSLILLCRISGGVIPPSRRSLAGNYTSELMQPAKFIIIILG